MLWTGFKDRYGAHLTPDVVEVGDAYADALPRMQQEAREGPFALTHNDYRLDNMLFGKPGSPKPLAVVDWQTAGKGAPASDVAYFIGAGLTRDDRPRITSYNVCYTKLLRAHPSSPETCRTRARPLPPS